MVAADGAVHHGGQSDGTLGDSNEVGCEGSGACDSEAARVLCAAVAPVDKIPTRVGDGGQRAGRVFVKVTSTCDGTCVSRVGISRDEVLRASYHRDGGDVRLILLTGDHYHGSARRGLCGNRHFDSTAGRHLSHTDDFVVDGNGHIGTGNSTYGKGGNTQRQEAIVAHSVHFWLGDVRHH